MFPNFMTLTEEEKQEFYQTFHAAKIKLEKSGVTVNPRFGTVHDNSWQNSDDLRKRRRKNNNVFMSPEIKIGEQEANIPEDVKSNTSMGLVNPAYSNPFSSTSRILENPMKNFKKDKIPCEADSSLPSDCNDFEEKEEICAEGFTDTLKNYSMKKCEENVTPLLSCEILNESNEKISKDLEKKKDVLTIQGTNLKVQVTLTSADNKRKMKTLPTAEKVIDDRTFEKSSGKTPNVTDGTERTKARFDDVQINEKKSAEESLDDPEVKNLLKVDDESDEFLPFDKEQGLSKKEEKSEHKITNKSSSKLKKKGDKEKKVEFKSKKKVFKTKKPGLENVEGQKMQSKKNYSQELLLSNGKWELDLDDALETFKEHRDSKEIAKNKRKKTRINEQNDEGSCRRKENKKPTEQKILVVKTSNKRKKWNISWQKPKTAIMDKKRGMIKPVRQLLVRKQGKNLKDKESFHSEKNELKVENENNASGFNEEEVISEKQNIVKRDTETASTQTETLNAIPCLVEKPEEFQEVEENPKGGKISDSVQVPDSAGTEISPDEEKKVPEFVENRLEEEALSTPPFMSGKVVFVDDNVIEKIRNVILDLEKKARTDESDTENEYLILLVEHVEYLSSVVATLFESQVLNPTAQTSSVKFGEENLAEIENYLQVSTTTTENDFESDEEIDVMKRLKKKTRKSSLSKLFRKLFNSKKVMGSKKSSKR